MAVKTFEVELKDNISPNAKNAAGQVRLLTSAMTSLEKAAVRSAALGDVSGLEKAANQYRALATEVNRLGSTFPAASSGASSLASAAEFAGPAIAFVAEAALAAGAAIGVVLVAALYAAGVAAVAASDRARTLTAAFEALAGGAPGAGEATLGAVRDIAKSLPESEKTVESWARTLMGAGLTDMSALQASLKAVAGAEALVEGGGERVKSTLAGLAEQAAAGGGKVKFSLKSLSGTGLTEHDFLGALGMTPANFAAAKKAGTLTGAQVGDAITRALNAKAGGALAATMNTWEAAYTKGKDLIVHIFEGVDTSKLVQGVRDFFDVFDLANPSGQAMKQLVTDTFDALFGTTEKLAPSLKVMFLEVELGALKALNYLRPLVVQFNDWMSDSGGWQIVKTVVLDTAAAIGIVAGAITAVVGIAVAASALLVVSVTQLAIGVYGLITGIWGAVYDFVPKAFEAGKNLVSGFADGIKSVAGTVVDAVESMSKDAWDKLTGFWKSHSPSQRAFELGANIGEGQALGVESKASRVEKAHVATSAAPIARGAGSGGGSARAVEFHLTVNAKDGATADEIVQLVEETYASMIERFALSQGMAEMSGGTL